MAQQREYQRQGQRDKLQVRVDAAWIERLDHHRGTEVRSHYIERVLGELWDRMEFKAGPPQPDVREFFGSGAPR